MALKPKLRIRTDLTKFRTVEPVYSKLKTYLLCNSLSNIHNPLAHIAVWVVQVTVDMEHPYTKGKSNFIYQVKFEDALDYFSALTIAMSMVDDDFSEHFNCDDPVAEGMCVITNIVALANVV